MAKGEPQDQSVSTKNPLPLLGPRSDSEDGCGESLLDPGEEQQDPVPHICRLSPRGAVSPGVPQVVILTAGGRGAPASPDPQLALPWQALQSPHDPLFLAFRFPRVSEGWGFSQEGPRKAPPRWAGGCHMMPLVRYWKPS